jgi:coenzyme F420-reducing hydrogenase delta subunit
MLFLTILCLLNFFVQPGLSYALRHPCKLPLLSQHLPASVTSLAAPAAPAAVVKVIAGLHNFNPLHVRRVVEASIVGGASHVDIACSAGLVRIAKNSQIQLGRKITVCVSDVNPENFLNAMEAGADMVEIGNFDGFYSLGQSFPADLIVKLTKTTRKYLPDTPLSVTVPHTLSLNDQTQLAKELERCGADIIQTEGKVMTTGDSGVTALYRAQSAILSAFALSNAVSIPVWCASGLDDTTASLALQAGARGVGVGRFVTCHNQQVAMEQAVQRLVSRLRAPASALLNVGALFSASSSAAFVTTSSSAAPQQVRSLSHQL